MNLLLKFLVDVRIVKRTLLNPFITISGNPKPEINLISFLMSQPESQRAREVPKSFLTAFVP